MSAFAVRKAHKCAMKLVDLSEPIWRFLEVFREHNVAPEAIGRLRELFEMRERLRACLDEAEKTLKPQLEEFACVHEKPLEVNGFTVPSAHKGALKVGEWALAPGRAADRIKAFMDRYYDVANKRVNWERARDDRDEVVRFFGDNDSRERWAEHRAMLEIELAKAMRLPPVKRAEVKLNVKEQAIVTALGHETLQYKQIAARAALKANSEFRKKLAEMVSRGLLEGGEEGYSLGRLLS